MAASRPDQSFGAPGAIFNGEFSPTKHSAAGIHNAQLDRAPLLSSDDQALYFYSDRRDSRGDQDLWIT